MAIYKLNPNVKEYIWGGQYFKKYGKGLNLDKVSECWELSFNKDNESFDSKTGKKITEVVNESSIGPVKDEFPFFPVLIKLIDAKDNLSVQVHPSDEYALKNENQFGKEEMWHILSADEGAGIYVGFNKDYTKEEVYDSLNDGSILNKLNFFKVKPGETYLIKAGTVHAIGAGVRLIEIQQNSTLTYRLYDYKRVDKEGHERELHIDKAIKVLNFKKYVKENSSTSLLAKTKYFTVSRTNVVSGMKVRSGERSFKSITFIEGEGTINNIPYKIYDTFYIPYGEEAIIEGNGVIIETVVD